MQHFLTYVRRAFPKAVLLQRAGCYGYCCGVSFVLPAYGLPIFAVSSRHIVYGVDSPLFSRPHKQDLAVASLVRTTWWMQQTNKLDCLISTSSFGLFLFILDLFSWRRDVFLLQTIDRSMCVRRCKSNPS